MPAESVPSARDRAAEVMAETLSSLAYDVHGPLLGDDTAAQAVVHALLARPEVLAALAGTAEVSDAELDAAAEALGWPGDPTARTQALVALTVAARARALLGHPTTE